MGERLGRNFEAPRVGKGASRRAIVVSGEKVSPWNIHRHIGSLNSGRIGCSGSDVAIFLLKVAALETVRRVSKAKCSYVWNGIQALQFLCYPPLTWVQRWHPFKRLIKGMQGLSRPLLVISIATVLSDLSEFRKDFSDSVGPSDACSESCSETTSIESSLERRTIGEPPQNLVSEEWLIRTYKELDNHGISLPARINEHELRRYYAVGNGDFSTMLSAIKKTIRWRDNFRFLSEEELETWSDMVFWHGFDLKKRPCLIVKLGLACLNVPSHEKPRFAQAVISQVEHGVLHLVASENSEITVLVDCEGLSPLRIPMQMMRSCCSLLQDHFPNRLGCLLVIRLPAVVRVIAQTFIRVLRPTTQTKLKIEGETFQKMLSEYLQTVPSYLGANCTCTRCSKVSNQDMSQIHAKKVIKISADTNVSDSEDLNATYTTSQNEVDSYTACDKVLRTAIISMLMLCLYIAIIIFISNS